MEDVVKDDVVEEGADKDPDDDEDARLGKDFREPLQVVEDDLEYDNTNYHTCNHSE